MTQKNTFLPTEIRLNSGKDQLSVAYESGSSFEYTAEYLRVMSPSAEVQGHSPDQRKTVPGKSGVLVKAIEPVGKYAVKIVFDDGHDTGIYSWDYLNELGREHAERWQEYLGELESKNLSRTR